MCLHWNIPEGFTAIDIGSVSTKQMQNKCNIVQGPGSDTEGVAERSHTELFSTLCDCPTAINITSAELVSPVIKYSVHLITRLLCLTSSVAKQTCSCHSRAGAVLNCIFIVSSFFFFPRIFNSAESLMSLLQNLLLVSWFLNAFGAALCLTCLCYNSCLDEAQWNNCIIWCSYFPSFCDTRMKHYLLNILKSSRNSILDPETSTIFFLLWFCFMIASQPHTSTFSLRLKSLFETWLSCSLLLSAIYLQTTETSKRGEISLLLQSSGCKAKADPPHVSSAWGVWASECGKKQHHNININYRENAWFYWGKKR